MMFEKVVAVKCAIALLYVYEKLFECGLCMSAHAFADKVKVGGY